LVAHKREEHRLRVFENRVLRTFGPKRNGVKEQRRKLCNEELSDVYCSSNILLVIKLRRMRWAGHVAIWGNGEVHSGFWWGNPRERICLENPSVDGRIILRWNSGNGMGNLDWIDLAQGRGRL